MRRARVAWRQVAGLVGDDLPSVIEGELSVTTADGQRHAEGAQSG